LIEVRTDRHDNPGVHDRLDEAAARRVGEVREEGRR
jgi:hypothetical protein